MFETRGHKAPFAQVDGGLYMVKKPIRTNKSLSVILPKDWVELNSLEGDIKYLLLEQRDGLLIIKAYHKDIEGVN